MSGGLLYVGSHDGPRVASVSERLVGTTRHYVGVERSDDGTPDGPALEQPTGEHLVLCRADEPSPAEWSARAGAGEVRRVYVHRRAWTTDGRDGAELRSP